MKYRDLTKGNISISLLLFALPMVAGNLMQQLYNVVDTLIVGRILGKTALAAVGSSYSLMTFLTSIILGLCLGSGALFSIYQGRKEEQTLKEAIDHAFLLILALTVLLSAASYLLLEPILWFLHIPKSVQPQMRVYLLIVFAGLLASSLSNFFFCLLRALGNSLVPLLFLACSSLLNVGLDLLFVAVFPFGVAGAAAATVAAQYFAAIGIVIYMRKQCPALLPKRNRTKFQKNLFREIWSMSALTCLQQSVMNFGILMVQGIVNQFGTAVMAAFAAGVKIDTLAYLPVQDFGNAYSTFVAQNYGAGQEKRLKQGTREAVKISVLFSMLLSFIVVVFAKPLMEIFVSAKETGVVSCGVTYLRIEGACYLGIGCLFLLYGYYRAIKQAMMSLVLTVISLGTRVVLAYVLSAQIGVIGIWLSIPIGWVLADLTGLIYGKRHPVQF